ncbi:MAG: hypothetical protein AB7I79_15740 [Rhizobiaceae bacterium]
MDPENTWDLVRNERGWRLGDAGIGALRATLLFGSAAIALALILVPIMEDLSGEQQAYNSDFSESLDMTSTGSVSPSGAYTVRRSILQPSPDSVCYIRTNGARVGDC